MKIFKEGTGGLKLTIEVVLFMMPLIFSVMIFLDIIFPPIYHNEKIELLKAEFRITEDKVELKDKLRKGFNYKVATRNFSFYVNQRVYHHLAKDEFLRIGTSHLLKQIVEIEQNQKKFKNIAPYTRYNYLLPTLHILLSLSTVITVMKNQEIKLLILVLNLTVSILLIIQLWLY